MFAPTMPKIVAHFERIMYAAIVLNLVALPLNWDMIGSLFNKHPIVLPVSALLYFGLQAWWIWLIARKRKNWARGVSPIYLAITLPLMIRDLVGLYPLLVGLAFGTVYVMQCVAVAFLFTRSARPWFHSDGGAVAHGAAPPSPT